MRRFIYFILIFKIAISCTSKKQDVQDINELIPREEETEKNDQVVVQKKYDFGFDTTLMRKQQIFFDSMQMEDVKLMPDRFSPIKTKKTTIFNKEKAIQVFEWDFKDSIQARNAFYNWIDCYGTQCKSIKIGQEKNFQKEAMGILLENNQLLFINNVQKSELEAWQSYFINKNKWKSVYLIIEQGSWQKAKWFKIVNEQKEKWKSKLNEISES